MHASYTPDMTMRTARDLYFDVNGFGADGGYSEPWVDFKLGPLPLPFPNTAGRIAAVKFHDLHHVLTGYETNAIGEFEISAWELGAGCAKLPCGLGHQSRWARLGAHRRTAEDLRRIRTRPPESFALRRDVRAAPRSEGRRDA